MDEINQGIIIKGINIDTYLSPSTTSCIVDGQQFKIRIINSTNVLCIYNELQTGYHSVKIDVA